MFPAEKKGEFEPYKIHERRQEVPVNNGTSKPPQEDVEMKDAGSAQQQDAPKKEAENETSNEADKTEKTEGNTEGTENTEHAGGDSKEESKPEVVEEVVYEEDVNSDEGAVYPIQKGRIVDWPCFFALLMHIRNSLSPPLHTPIIIISQPVWTARDCETITQFVFEKFKTPGFALMDSALAACYGYGTSTATVVDVGQGKVDVTAVTEYMVNEYGRGIALEGCAGESMTDRLEELLGPKGFSRDMCEQLKRSSIVEILPPGTPLPSDAVTAHQGPTQVASLASTGATDGEAPSTDAPRGPGENTQTGEGGNPEDEGVLNVAEIVTGNTGEILSKREKEKTEKEKSASKKGADQAAQRLARLPNSKREMNSFQLDEYIELDAGKEAKSGPKRFVHQKREIEVGVERFLAATPKEQSGNSISNGVLDDIATQIHHTISSVPEAGRRGELWDSLLIVGNGSKIKGKSPRRP